MDNSAIPLRELAPSQISNRNVAQPPEVRKLHSSNDTIKGQSSQNKNFKSAHGVLVVFFLLIL